MNYVVVDFITPSGVMMEGTKIPKDYTIREIIFESVDLLDLRRTVNGQVARYALKLENYGWFLAEDQTLTDAGVTHGQILQLSTLEDVAEQSPVVGTGETAEGVLAPPDFLHKRNHVVIDLLMPSGAKMAGTKIPTDYTVREIISELIEHLELRSHVDGTKVGYALKWENRGSLLAEDQTLTGAGVVSGETLQLYSPDRNGGRVVEIATGKTVEVRLTLPDLGLDGKQVFETDVPVETLIDDITTTYQMLKSDHDNRRVHYELISKYLGRWLSPTKTLAEEGCVSGDRLILRKACHRCG